MSHAQLLRQLLPPVSYASDEPSLSVELDAEATVLDRAQGDADAIEDAITPYYAHQYLPDWERVCGITPAHDAPLQQRISTVVAKLSELGGLSIPYFIRIATALGYRIEIVEPDPFRVDAGRTGQALWLEGVTFQWGVIVHGKPELTYYFRLDESAVGESLMSASDPILEQVIRDLKPAETFVFFMYMEA